MFIHIGSGDVMHSDRIIGIFDFPHMAESKENRNILEKVKKGHAVEGVSPKVAKSLIIADSGIIYLSLVATGTLKKRVQSERERCTGK